MNPPIRFFSPSETARRLGVSVKALRVYEAEGLVRPARTASGWRAYGPEQMARLHQVLALKRLGLPLRRIGDLLAGSLSDLDAVLALQEEALRRRRVEVEQGLSLLRRARDRLGRGEALSADDLMELTRDTTMTDNRIDPAEWRRVFDPLIDKHFTADERSAFVERNQREGEGGQAAWAELIGEAKALMARGADPGSTEAMDLGRRWMTLARRFTGGDPEVMSKLQGVWGEAFEDPAFRQRSPVSPEMMAFIGAAARLAHTAGLLAFP